MFRNLDQLLNLDQLHKVLMHVPHKEMKRKEPFLLKLILRSTFRLFFVFLVGGFWTGVVGCVVVWTGCGGLGAPVPGTTAACRPRCTAASRPRHDSGEPLSLDTRRGTHCGAYLHTAGGHPPQN